MPGQLCPETRESERNVGLGVKMLKVKIRLRVTRRDCLDLRPSIILLLGHGRASSSFNFIYSIFLWLCCLMHTCLYRRIINPTRTYLETLLGLHQSYRQLAVAEGEGTHIVAEAEDITKCPPHITSIRVYRKAATPLLIQSLSSVISLFRPLHTISSSVP